MNEAICNLIYAAALVAVVCSGGRLALSFRRWWGAGLDK